MSPLMIGDRVVPVFGSGTPPRLLLFDQPQDWVERRGVVVADGSVQGRDARSLRQHQMDGDFAFSVLCQGWPVAGDRLVEIDHALVGEDKEGDRR
jgi:hypothetical protein